MDRWNMVFETAVVSHTGCVRAHNEDSYLSRPGSGLWVVSDGMGGHEAGRFASATVVEELGHVNDASAARDLLAECRRGLERANAALRAHAAARGVDMVGATVVALLVRQNAYACIWSGDSRVYRVRGGRIDQLTRDHSEVEELVGQGVLTREEARTWPRRNVVTRAIGAAREAELEIVDGTVEPGDTFVLCSDGLTAHVEDARIADLAGAREPQAAADALLALALERGGRDNVTIIVVRCVPREPTVSDLQRKPAPNWTEGQ